MSVMVRRSRQLYSDPVTDYMTGYVDHRVEGVAAFQTDYPVKIRVYRGYGSNTGQSVYIPQSELSHDFRDIRFADGSGRLLPHWLETTGTNYADFWLKLPVIPTTGIIVRIIFGGGIASASNGFDVFPFFDDFNDASLNSSLWASLGGTVTESNGALSVTGTGGSWQGVYGKTTFGTGYALRASINFVHASSASYHETLYWTDAGASVATAWYAAFAGGTPFTLNNYDGAGANVTTGSVTANTYNTVELRRGTDRSAVSINDGTATENTGHYPTGSYYPEIRTYNSGAQIITDWLAVRKYLATEPTHGWWGPLEDL